MTNWRFYRCDFPYAIQRPAPLCGRFRFEFWQPSLSQFVPRGLPVMPFGAWWVFHQLRVFKNQDYSVALIYDGDRIVHRDVVYPDFFRFPCMSTTDLILSDIWTDEDCRGQGLAAAAMQEIVRVYSRPGRVLWCITAEDNRPCIRVLEKSGFVYAGTGTRTRRWGLHALGAFELTGSV